MPYNRTSRQDKKHDAMPLTDNTAVAYRLRFFMMVQEWFPFDIYENIFLILMLLW